MRALLQQSFSGLRLHASAGVTEVAGGGLVSSGAGETVARHVGVDALGVSRGDLIGLVPDADDAVRVSRALVEGLPRGKVFGIVGLGVGEEVVEAAPVLDEVDSAPDDAVLGGEEAERGVGGELADHGRHGLEGGPPFMRGQQAVDAYADEEDDEGAVDAGGVTAFEDGGHSRRRIPWGERGCGRSEGSVGSFVTDHFCGNCALTTRLELKLEFVQGWLSDIARALRPVMP